MQIYYTMEYLLSSAPHNKQLFIKSVNISQDDLARRFSELGFVCGQKISVIGAPTKHNILVNVRGSVFALDCSICNKVVVYD